jgi:enoyl-CoA hydratase
VVAVTDAAPGVRVLTVDRPPVNAFDAALYDEAAAELARLAEDRDLRALVLTGAGERAFSAGTDLTAPLDEVKPAGRRFFDALSLFPRPVVGAINAPAVGGGAMIAAECDVLVACPEAFFQIPELAHGLVGGGAHIKRLVSLFRAQRMLLLGERLTAEEAEREGLLAALVPRAEVVPKAVSCAVAIAALDPQAVAAARAVFREEEAARIRREYARELGLDES